MIKNKLARLWDKFSLVLVKTLLSITTILASLLALIFAPAVMAFAVLFSLASLGIVYLLILSKR